MKTTTVTSGRMILNNDKPEDFNAVNSLFSARFPNVMIELSKIARGKASGIKLAET